MAEKHKRLSLKLSHGMAKITKGQNCNQWGSFLPSRVICIHPVECHSLIQHANGLFET